MLDLLGSIADGVPLPIEATALGLLGAVVVWLMRKDNQVDAGTMKRIDALEKKVLTLEREMNAERSAKHKAMSEAASFKGSLRVVQLFGAECTCGTFSRLDPLLAEALKLDLAA